MITEFQALGTAGNAGEFVELFSTATDTTDLGGVTFTNAAGVTVMLHPASNPTGMGPILLLPSAHAYGVPNPANPSLIPLDAAFVYGDPGTAFELADVGDLITVRDASNALLDEVDFRILVTNPDLLPGPAQFPAFPNHSTQLDPLSLDVALNDNGSVWCTSFRAAHTAGLPNLSCSAMTVVINEVVYDGALGADNNDQRKTFVELAGPGGASLSGLLLRGVEGSGPTAGALQGSVDIGALLPNRRMPVDGLLVVADNTGGPSQTVPPLQQDLNTSLEPLLENGDDALQLLLVTGAITTLVDVVGYAGDGVLDAVLSVDGFQTFMGTPARDANQGIALARNIQSINTVDNLADFALDPSPSPGQPNVAPATTLSSVTPSSAPATASTSVTLVGTDLAFNATITFAGTVVPTAACNFNLVPNQVTCLVPPGMAGRGDISYVNTVDRGGGSALLPNGWTFTTAQNETDNALEADFCNLQFPFLTSTTVNVASAPIFGQIFEAGRTDATAGAAAPGIGAELGYGPLSTDPRSDGSWRFFPATFNVETGFLNNNDEYMGSLTIPVQGTFAYTFRFTLDDGLSYTYCDQGADAGGDGGSGSNGGLTFEPNRLGTITVN